MNSTHFFEAGLDDGTPIYRHQRFHALFGRGYQMHRSITTLQRAGLPIRELHESLDRRAARQPAQREAMRAHGR